MTKGNMMLKIASLGKEKATASGLQRANLSASGLESHDPAKDFAIIRSPEVTTKQNDAIINRTNPKFSVEVDGSKEGSNFEEPGRTPTLRLKNLNNILTHVEQRPVAPNNMETIKSFHLW